MPEKISAVIFDLDGTIADTLPLCIKAFRHSIEPLINRSLSDEEIIATFGPSEEGTIMALAPDHYEQGIKSYLHHYKQMHNMCGTAFEGVEDILNQLQRVGVRIAMVTGKGKHSTAISLKHFDLTSYFEIIETGSPEGARKEMGIKAVLNHFTGIGREEIIYVGDAPSDIIASRKNNINVVAAAWAATAEPAQLIELSPNVIFYSVKDFAEWLNKRVQV